ncbi:MAG: SPOR domain-containing protein [Metallibacterium scheffleri]|jgi:cell division protein FtsN|uniref:SPOR domain-containing protein n=1 Tax=Metallibacterium scheffleri TaxID=993689 RepID=UPI0026EC5E1E|nr:SPOR domain-containing protein [Metallibacterium scheffleri]MCK9366439.1 SPOR domain-containing protein [Metallibacterium scheffleri]
MADKRKKQAVRSGGVPAWMLVGIGILIGAGGMGYVAHRGWIPSLRSNAGPEANPNATAPGAGEGGIAEAGTAKKPSFDFYQVLPGKEVVIPDAELSAKAKAETQAQAAAAAATPQPVVPGATPAVASTRVTPAAVGPATSSGGYVLQVGAFPDNAKAQAVKAKLALQGFVAHVQVVKIGQQTWYRVRLGPYANAAQLEKIKHQLSGAGIPTIALKENG